MHQLLMQKAKIKKVYFILDNKTIKRCFKQNEYSSFAERYQIKKKGNFKPENGSVNPGFNLLSKSTQKTGMTIN